MATRRKQAKRRESSSPVCYVDELEAPPSGEADIHLKRIYDKPARADGLRVLVDRLWPRGISKTAARLDAWARDLAPSTELRQWYHAHLDEWAEFRRRYLAELVDRRMDLQALAAQARRRRVTLLFGARDLKVNHASVLREAILTFD